MIGKRQALGAQARTTTPRTWAHVGAWWPRWEAPAVQVVQVAVDLVKHWGETCPRVGPCVI